MLTNYSSVNPQIWTGRVDDPHDRESFRFHQVIKTIDLNKLSKIRVDRSKFNVALLGFRSDEGIRRNLGRPGAQLGPEYIRRELANLPVTFDENIEVYDAGDIYTIGQNLEDAQDQLANAVEILLDLGMFPVLLGGGHEIALGHYNGIVNHFEHQGQKPSIGIINFDAHFDLRPYKEGYGSSGTMFAQIADNCKSKQRPFNYMVLGIQTYANTISLFKRAQQLGTRYILAKDMTEDRFDAVWQAIDGFIRDNDHIYLTICSDVFNAAFAPGVSATQPFGLHPETVLYFLKKIIATGKVLSWDIAEISPRFDHDNRTAKLAAVLIYAVINEIKSLPAYHKNL